MKLLPWLESGVAVTVDLGRRVNTLLISCSAWFSIGHRGPFKLALGSVAASFGITCAQAFVVPYRASVSVQAVGGAAGAISDFGTGTTPDTFVSYLADLPRTSTEVISVSTFQTGENIRFAIRTPWDGAIYYAFEDGTDPASIVAFDDSTSNLPVFERLSETQWLLH